MYYLLLCFKWPGSMKLRFAFIILFLFARKEKQPGRDGYWKAGLGVLAAGGR